MIDYWCMVDSILGGAPAMREAGIKYLPRFQNEKATKDADGNAYDPYEQRRRHAPFTNIYADNSRNLASKPFAKELKLKDGAPAQYSKLGENIDGQGNSFHVVGADVFKRGLDKGIDWVLVDYTKVPAGATLAAERQMGARPYWVHVPSERLLAVYSDFVNGQEVIYHARIEENATALDGFDEVCIERVRVLERQRLVDADGNTVGFAPATWAIWEATTETVNGSAQKVWAMTATGPITIGVIPLVPFIAGDRRGSSWIVEPPLRDVAFLQIEEYQQESNLKNIADLTCFPMLTGNGVTPPADGIVPVGPRAVLFAPMGADGTFGGWEFIEPTAESIQKIMDRLDKTQTMMRDLGAQPMMQANLTVVMSNQQAVKANSQVQAWAFKFKDAMEQCWKLTAMWLGAKDEPEVEIHTDFSIDFQDSAEMQQLNTAQSQGVVSKRLLFSEYQRRGMISENANFDKDQEDVAKDQEGLEPEQNIDPVTGQPIDPTVPPSQQQAA
jgi:hypothetical protein